MILIDKKLRLKKYLQILLKVFLWTVGSLISLFLILFLVIQIPSVQNYAKNKAVHYLEEKIKTKVVIDSLEIGFPKKVILKGVYFEDQKKDTLFAGDTLAVNISLFQLINNKVDINSVDLSGITAYIKKDSKGNFNFDYIIKALASQEKQKTDSAPMEFSVDEIQLDRINFHYSDAISNNEIATYLNHFKTSIKTFDLNQMNFDIPKIKVNGLQFKLIQGIASIKKSGTVTENNTIENPLKLKFGDVDLGKIKIEYKSQESKLATNIYVKKLITKLDKIDLNNQYAILENLELTGVEGALELGKIKKLVTQNTKTSNSSNNWDIKVKKSVFKRINFKYDNNNVAFTQKGLDYNHLDIKSLNLDLEVLNYNNENISGELKSFSAKDKSGLNISALNGDFFYGNKNAFIKNLYLKTPQTEIKNEIQIGYSSLATISKNIGDLSLIANLTKSSIGFQDILLFVPNLASTNPFKSNPKAVISINGKVKGKVKNITIPSMEISGIGSTSLAASGTIIGLPNVDKTYFDINIKKFQSGQKDINNFVPKGTIPNTIQLPSRMTVTGTFKGTIATFLTDLKLISSYGNAAIKAKFDQSRKNFEKYDAKADFVNFDLGKFIKNDSIGKITLKTTIKGTGFNPKTATVALNASIQKAYFNKYTYKNIAVKGTIQKGNFNATAVARDPNLTFNLVGNGRFQDKYPSGKIKLNVDIADLEKLNLHAGPLKIRGIVDADIQSGDLDYLNGSLTAHHINITNAKENYTIDSIQVHAIANAQKNSIEVKAPFMDAFLEGKYKLSKIGTAITNSIAAYYDTTPKKSKKKTKENQQFDFKVQIKDSPIVMQLIPQIKSLEPITITGNYNSVNDSIVLNGAIPKLVYESITVTNATLKLDTQDQKLLYNFMVDDIQNEQFELPHTELTGDIQNNIITYALQLKNTKEEERYLIAGTVQSQNGGTEIRLNPDKLILNYEPWTIDKENVVSSLTKGLFINNFNLKNNGSTIQVQSKSSNANAPLQVNFKEFDINTITSFVEKKDLQLSGKINGTAEIRNLNTSPLFTSDLSVENFTFKKDTIGNIKLQVNNTIANQYDAVVAITGQGNQVNLEGNYKTTTSSFDMNLIIDKLNLKSIQGFTLNNLTESTGFLNGKLSITGSASQPNVQGELAFNEIGFKVTPLNARFKSINDKIVFQPNTIVFETFTIKDENDNELNVNGTIDTSNFSNFGFNLTVDAKNFKAVNSKAKDNDLYYGELFLDNNIRIAGSLNNPIIDGTIKINRDTKFTIVLPQSDPSIADREGIVEFIDQDNPQIITNTNLENISSESTVKGINASVNIEIDKDAELSLVIDKANGDYLKLKGEAQLTGGIDASGKTNLTGRYELNEGSYEMNFNGIKRKFNIKEGSYILWTGEPTSADINITAIYKTNAAPIDLVNDQLGDITPTLRNTYKEKIPFETALKMNGDLMKPNISFDIILPDGNNNVSTEIINTTQAKLSQLREQQDELNKQVFALLLLNRFIGENPFTSENGGTTVSSLARESASKILSQQLNNLAGDLIQGIELNFDLNTTEDFTSGQRQNKTDFSVGVSKKLLNDRLKITVGSSFGIEGSQQANQNANNIAGDVSIDYQLTKDGRYKVRAYRVNKYQVALQGEVVETGVAFVITMDYNKFSELFRKNASKK
nr:translocation/assembly module TamB [Flavobacterium sp. SOK18b]